MGLNTRRKFTDEEKIQILQEGTVNGVPQTLRKYEIGQRLFIFEGKKKANRIWGHGGIRKKLKELQ